MALFAKKAGSTDVTSGIPSIVMRTSNIAKELIAVAANHKIPIKTLDFRLLDTQTFIRMLTDGEDWIEVNDEEIHDITEQMYLNENFQLKQIYEIEVHTIAEEPPLSTLDVSIAGNGTLCKIYFTIKEGSTAVYDENFENNLYDLIKKKKLRANLMIGIFDSMVRQNLLDLLSKLRVYGTFYFEEQERYIVAEGYEPIETIDDKLILHYEQKQREMDESGRINYAKRGYIVSVVENDLLIEYIKPSKGTIGRNVRGELIIPKDPVVRYEPTFTHTENIKRIELDKTIEFRANTSGYVTLEGGVYDIKSEMDMKEISFRSTGSIDTNLDAGVSINVKENDIIKDAIGTGMSVTVNMIHVEGNVGEDAKITANKATIEGQVHSTATVTADELSINILKGKAFGKEVRVSRLEHGEIEAEKVYVTQATGGKIRAKEVYIELLGSHVKVTASKKIEITKLLGGENILIIDPLLNESRESLKKQEHKIEEAKNIAHHLEKELLEYDRTLKENASAYQDIKQKLLYYKRNSIKAPSAFVEKFQQFQQFKQKHEELRIEYQEKLDHYNLLNEHYAALQNEIFEARVINHDRWHNYNEVIFKLIEPPIDVAYLPVDNSDANNLGLHEEDGEFTIKVVHQ